MCVASRTTGICRPHVAVIRYSLAAQMRGGSQHENSLSVTFIHHPCNIGSRMFLISAHLVDVAFCWFVVVTSRLALMSETSCMSARPRSPRREQPRPHTHAPVLRRRLTYSRPPPTRFSTINLSLCL